MTDVRLIIDGAEMAKILRGRNGPVARYLDKQSYLFQQKARSQAPRRTGCLQDNIRRRWERNGEELAVRVISSTVECSPKRIEYALYVHDGTAPHDIPNAFGRGPQFGIGGRFEGKFHPGYAGNHYLTDNLWIFEKVS